MHRAHVETGLKDPVQIQYRDFYDIPRMFVVAYRGIQYLFDCSFDDQLDDYPSEYQVFALPALTREQLSASWESLPQQATRFVGKVATGDVAFDRSKRQAIEASIFDRLPDAR